MRSLGEQMRISNLNGMLRVAGYCLSFPNVPLQDLIELLRLVARISIDPASISLQASVKEVLAQLVIPLEPLPISSIERVVEALINDDVRGLHLLRRS